MAYMLMSFCALLACSGRTDTEQSSHVTNTNAADTLQSPEELSRIILQRFKEDQSIQIAPYIHPVLGVRISPYGFIDTLLAQRFTRMDWEDLHMTTSDKVRLWGYYDGSGDSIHLNWGDYYSKFIYDADFLQSPLSARDSLIGKGNSLMNFQDLYPACSFTEHHFPGFNPEYSGMDWKSLRLVYQLHQNSWYLVAIIHDQWTI